MNRSLGLDLLPALLTMPLLKGELCTRNVSVDTGALLAHGKIVSNDVAENSTVTTHVFASCNLIRPLRILVLHNHCPLFTRYKTYIYFPILT